MGADPRGAKPGSAAALLNRGSGRGGLNAQFVRKVTSEEVSFTARGSLAPSSCRTTVLVPGFKSTVKLGPGFTAIPLTQAALASPWSLKEVRPPLADWH